MIEADYNIEPHIQKQIDHGSSGLDIMHGQLKILMVEAEDELRMAQEIEEENDYSDAMESMDRKYWEGYTDALGALYSLTYQLSFAIAEREQLTNNQEVDTINANQLQKGNTMQHEHYWDTPSSKSLVAECACGEQLERVQD